MFFCMFSCVCGTVMNYLCYGLNLKAIKQQGQKFVAVLKVKNRGAATRQNVKNRGIVAAKIVKIAAISRQKS